MNCFHFYQLIDSSCLELGIFLILRQDSNTLVSPLIMNAILDQTTLPHAHHTDHRLDWLYTEFINYSIVYMPGTQFLKMATTCCKIIC